MDVVSILPRLTALVRMLLLFERQSLMSRLNICNALVLWKWPVNAFDMKSY